METPSENMNTEKNGTLSFRENEDKDGTSQYTLNGVVLFLTEKLGRVIGIATRESERILSKASRGIVVGAKGFGKKGEVNKTKASKSEVEEIPASGAQEAVHTKEVKDDTKKAQNDAASDPEDGKASQEVAGSQQDTAVDNQVTASNKKQRQKKEETEIAASDANEKAPSAIEEE